MPRRERQHLHQPRSPPMAPRLFRHDPAIHVHAEPTEETNGQLPAWRRFTLSLIAHPEHDHRTVGRPKVANRSGRWRSRISAILSPSIRSASSPRAETPCRPDCALVLFKWAAPVGAQRLRCHGVRRPLKQTGRPIDRPHGPGCPQVAHRPPLGGAGPVTCSRNARRRATGSPRCPIHSPLP